ncbi:MAG: hypothetical protein ACPG4T_23010, partial [Nannocystaceae bacterium]
LQKLGEQASFTQRSKYAHACLEALKPARARAAITKAAAVPIPEGGAEERKKNLENLEQSYKNLLEYEQIGATKERALAIRRAELLLLLGRHILVGEQLKALHQQYPNDARVWVLQAQYEVNENFDFSAAAAAIDRARPLSPHNETYYEVALGTVVGVFMGDFLPKVIADPATGKPVLMQVLKRIDADIKGYAKFRPDRAAILDLVVTQARTSLPSDTDVDLDAWSREVIKRIVAPAAKLRTEYPTSVEVARFALVSSRFNADQKAAFAQAQTPFAANMPERDMLLNLQRKTVLDLAVTWRDKAQLGNLCQPTLTAKVPEKTEDRLVYATILALCAEKAGVSEAAQPAIDVYAQVVNSEASEMRLLALNNIGVLLALNGERSQAHEQLAAGVNHFPGQAAVPLLNLAELSPADQQIGMLLAVASNKPSPEAETVAWTRLKARLTPGSDDYKTVDGRLAELSAKGPGILPRVTDGSWGVLLSGEINIGLSYTVRTRLELNLDVASRLWLLLPSSVPLNKT